MTLKSQGALASAQELARDRNHQLVEPAHLLFALLSDPEGVVYPLLQKLGQSPRVLRDRVDELLDRIPKVYGFSQDLYLSQPTRHLLDKAFEAAMQLTDEFVSTEHLFLAMLDDTGDVSRLLKEAGLTRTGSRSWSGTAATSPSWPARASSTPSSDGTRRSDGSSRSCRVERRTTPC